MKFLYKFPGHTVSSINPDTGKTVIFHTLFALRQPDDETFYPIANISESSSRWKMHGSNQNNCFNVHVDGAIYGSPAIVPHNPSFDNPYFDLKNGSRTLTSFTDFCFTPYDESVWIDGPVFSYYVKSGKHKGSTATESWQMWFLWVRSGKYWIRFTDYVRTRIYSDGTAELPMENYHYKGAGLFFLSDSKGLPGSSSSSTTRVPASCQTEFTVNERSHEYSIDYVPPESELDKWVSKPSTSSQSYFEAPTTLVPPIRSGSGTYDVRFPDRKYHLDAAFADSLDQVDFTSSNGIAYGLDAKDIASQARSDLDSMRQLAKMSKGRLKIAGSLFLSFHYGWKLMASDTFEFADALKEYSKSSNRRVHCSCGVDVSNTERGGLRIIEGIAYRNVYYDPYARIATQTEKLAEAMDVIPDLSNIWDMIPFSFVVDWFTNIGDLAEGVDAFYTLKQQHRVLGTIDSTREKYEYRCEGYPGKYTYVIYERSCRRDWYPIPEFSFQFKNPLTNLTHWCEAGALVVATRP